MQMTQGTNPTNMATGPDNNEESLEVLPPSAIESLERANIDVQIATAHKYKRSMTDFRRGAMEMATLDQETAEECIYVRPVGKEQDEKTGKWVEKFAEGASIRLAEIVAANYGNLRVEARIIEQTPRFVRCAGMAHDLEKNYAGKSECVESTAKKDGTPYSERQRALVAKVCLAKAYRDAVFKVVPRALCKTIMDQCKKVAAGANVTIETRRKKVQAWVTQTLKIDESRVFAALGVAGWPDVGEEHLTTLTGIKTAIGNNDVRPDEAFPMIEGAEKKTVTPPASQTQGKPVNAPTNVTPMSQEKSQEKKPETKTEQVSSTAQTAAQQPAVPGQEQAAAASPQTPSAPPANVQPPATANADVTELSAEDCVKIITGNATAEGIAIPALLAYLVKKKVAKPENKELAELSTVKLQSIVKNWPNFSKDLKPAEQPAQ